jgi:hypothetical protein
LPDGNAEYVDVTKIYVLVASGTQSVGYMQGGDASSGGTTSGVTAGSVDLTTDVTGVLPIANGGTNSSVGSPTFDDMQITGHVYFDGEVDNGNSGASKTIDWTAGNNQKITTTGDCTLTFTPPTGLCHLTLTIIHEASATPYTYTYPATVKWADGSKFVTANTTGAVDIVNFYWNGTSYYSAGMSSFS